MNREQKESVIQSLKESFLQSKAAFLVNYQGLTVNQMQGLRRQLREKNGNLKVAKARLMKRAVDGVEGAGQLNGYFKEQVGLVFAHDEAPAVAKVLYDFSKENEALGLVVGYFDDRILASENIARIASLPSREVLLAQIAGTLKAPIVGLATTLNMVPTKLALALKAVGEKKK